MNQILTLLALALSMNLFGQPLKTFSGPFNDGRLQTGNATYTYYEDPNTHEYIKQGTFNYTFKGEGDYSGFNQTISGNFENGLRNGTWTHIIKMNDFGYGNPYSTGTITLTANYKNGLADGNWKEVRSYKTRRAYYDHGEYKWEPFEPLKTMTINMNFREGNIIGKVDINDEFGKFKATGAYDNNSLCTGTWIINDMSWPINRELIFRDNLLYEYITRDNNGKVIENINYKSDYDNLIRAKTMSLSEREEEGLIIDTIWGFIPGGELYKTDMGDYFSKLFTDKEYFLCNFIDGDLTYENMFSKTGSFKGFQRSAVIQIRKATYRSLNSSELEALMEGDNYYTQNDLLTAYEWYTSINLNSYDNPIKASAKNLVMNKISLIQPLIDCCLDSLKNDRIEKNVKLKEKNDSLIKSYINNSNQLNDYIILQYSALYKIVREKIRDVV